MKHAMTLKLLVAGACAFGGPALAQSGNATSAPTNPGGGADMTNPSGPAANTPAPDSKMGNDASAPARSMTRSQKKQSLDNIKKAVREAQSSDSRVSAEAGSDSAKNGKVEHLKVFRRGDKVILRGTVATQDDKERFGSAAESAAMGEQIVNELKVK